MAKRPLQLSRALGFVRLTTKRALGSPVLATSERGLRREKLRESALKSRESFARVNLRAGACPARPALRADSSRSTVRDDADVEGAEIREKRLAFAVAGEMNEIFDLARASSRTNSSAGP
jgi:hypothetical protein